MLYQTLDLEDFENWQAEYLLHGSGGENEYGKPASFMKAHPTPTHSTHVAKAVQAWVDDNNAVVWVKMEFNESLVQNYGAPLSVRCPC